MPLGHAVWIVLEAQVDLTWKTSWRPVSEYFSFHVLESMYDIFFLLSNV